MYDRGTRVRELQARASQLNGVDPAGLRTGYYPVREGEHRLVARWCPQAQRWEGTLNRWWPPRQWDEIGPRVA